MDKCNKNNNNTEEKPAESDDELFDLAGMQKASFSSKIYAFFFISSYQFFSEQTCGFLSERVRQLEVSPLVSLYKFSVILRSYKAWFPVIIF